MVYNKYYTTKNTPVNQPIAGREEDMVKNNAGGYVFSLDKWGQLSRFLILGSEGGSYYKSERKLSIQNSKNLMSCIKEDAVRVVKELMEINLAGRALKVEPQLFALALVASHGDLVSRQYALSNLSAIARTGTHLFTFLEYTTSHRGWGSALRKAVASWYLDKDPEKLAYQLVKYRQRNGWSHRDVLRLSHPKAEEGSVMNDVLKFGATIGTDNYFEVKESTPNVIKGYIELTSFNNKEVNKESVGEVVEIIRKYKIPREAIPTQFLGDKRVQEELLELMPITATIRNLGAMTSSGLLTPLSNSEKVVVDRVTSEKSIVGGRVHPISILLASKTYDAGGGWRGKLTWTPNNRITAALDAAFDMSFKGVEPSNKRYYVAVDVSGSMSSHIDDTHLRSCEVSAAIALYLARTEPYTYVAGFQKSMVPLNINAKTSLVDAAKEAVKSNFGSTDASSAIRDAMSRNIVVDVFVVITDNETWVSTHPKQALDEYRRKINPQAKLVVLATRSEHFSIADPNDSGMMDIAGFDSNFPVLLKEFANGFQKR